MDPIQEHETIVRWLRGPSSYPHRPHRVEQIQTHISQVFLAGEYVYKLKKPVRCDFLDFSTVAAREQACREEVRLNRRLAPDTYLDAVLITRGGGGTLRLGGRGEVVDWLVEMRRLFGAGPMPRRPMAASTSARLASASMPSFIAAPRTFTHRASRLCSTAPFQRSTCSGRHSS